MLVASLFTALTLAVGAFAAPYNPSSPAGNGRHLETREATPNSQGTHNGYFYLWWSDGESPTAAYSNGPKGSYTMEWKQPGNLFGGKGWKVGARRNIKYSASIERVDNGNSFISVYGVTRNTTAVRTTIIEYYIVETYGKYTPGSNGKSVGSVVVDGATYGLYYSTIIPQGLEGITHQYWAVREKKRTSGTVNTGAFIDAWAAAGLYLGTQQEWQILATEAYYSDGKSRVTISSPP